MSSSLSVVIPALNEIELLPDNTQALLSLACVDEVIVVDGGSTDGTVEWLEQHSARQSKLSFTHSLPGRALQMNAGAQIAKGDWLLFHHADSALSGAGVQAIGELPAAVNWGGFRHRFTPNNWKLRLVSLAHNLRCRLEGAIYGDQSMFARREFFQSLGGFPEAELEDLKFSDLALQKAPSCLLPHYVDTSSRKFLDIGEFKALWQVVSIVYRYQHEKPVGNESFFKPYR